MPLRLGDMIVETKRAAKYLGVLNDTKMSFFYEVRDTSDKAAKALSVLSRLMSHLGGPNLCRCRCS